jgi:hypothetical protein
MLPNYYISNTKTNSFLIRCYNYQSNSLTNINVQESGNDLPISVSMDESSGHIFVAVRYIKNATYCYRYANDSCSSHCSSYSRGDYCCGTYCAEYKYPWEVYQKIKIYNGCSYSKQIYVNSQEYNIDGGRTYAHKQKSKGFILTMRNGNIILYDMYRYPYSKFVIYFFIKSKNKIT